MRLDGKCIIITGATGGIGRAAAELFHEEGARLVLSDIDVDKGEALASQLSGSHFVPADICDSGQVNRLFEEAVDFMGKIDACFTLPELFLPLTFFPAQRSILRKS